ncbi:MAG TPA: DNA polymerase III subunit gamma/tau [Alphaproteobacteria bacterium]
MNDRPESTATSEVPAAEGGYRVLARKYRPALLADLVGQEVMVRTLANAFATGRIAHAFLLTGVRGIGKTTTARIIARALNCTGPDGSYQAPVAEPCGRCDDCRAIAEDRHVDVLEMDAASHTGVENMRDLIDRVRYAPAIGRFKVYIIDEIHMLSVPAFNALLKTLEEPPAHVKFVFATTEPRKIPVTVLSRCQRFDLRRVDAEVLAGHLAAIAAKEGAEVEDGALALIARAADGSVRDGLSMLDQAIGDAAPGPVQASQVREMLGLADRVRVFDLFEAVLGGRLATALDLLGEQYRAGADPVTVLQDLLELTHWLTRVAVTPEAAADPGLPEAERVRGRAMAEALGVPELARAWQVLLKGLREAQAAPQPLEAAEMVLVRLAHAADLPTPADLVRTLQAGEAAPAPGPDRGRPPSGGGASARPARPRAAAAAPLAEPAPARAPERAALPETFEAVVALFADRREAMLAAHLAADVHLVGFEPGRIEWRPAAAAPANLASAVSQRLGDWTGRRWVVAVSNEPGAPTLAEARAAGAEELRAEAARDPLVQSIIERFPGASIRAVRSGPERSED